LTRDPAIAEPRWHYLHFQSDSLLRDTLSVFEVKLSKLKFDESKSMFARILQDDMQLFLSDYRPCNKIEL
jgi:hypothetical protein